MAEKQNAGYAASLEIDYPNRLDRFTTFFRVLFAIPIVIVIGALTAAGGETMMNNETNQQVAVSFGGIVLGLFMATALMIVFRERYPKWWFDFALELNRFSTRVTAYLLLLSDKYPSTVEKQSVHLELKYPDVKKDLNRYLPLVKWLLALPHYIVLIFLSLAMLLATLIAWFAILFTGRYPKSLFDFVVGVNRWNLRVSAYAMLLITDKYPPFSLK